MARAPPSKRRIAKDLEALEQRNALLHAALRWTDPVAPDVMPPFSGYSLTKGYYLFSTGSQQVVVACSSSLSHSFGRNDMTTTQGPKALYSTRVLALKALRHSMECAFAAQLARIDDQIRAEEESHEV